MGFDIGMAPLVDNSFNRSKSNLRWLEYSSLGIPTVASNVGHFAQTIVNGKTGLLADTPEDFTAALESLILDTKKRKAIAGEAKQEVFNKFNIDGVAQQYKFALEEIIKRGQVRTTTANEKESNYKSEAEVS
jgi:glycosyltransferase involved in cell wall biosynthesis